MQIVPPTGHTGAEVHGLDLSRPVADEVRRVLDDAFLAHHVLVIRRAALVEHATQERFQYRHVWRPGDLVIWDNRCLLHKANGDYDMNEVRYLHRVMLKGEVPQ